MLYQDSRRVINPDFQEQPKHVRPRSISNTQQLLTWDTQQNKIKADGITNYITSNSDVRYVKQNQRNNSTILGGENFVKVTNKIPYYDFHEIMKNQHIIQSTKDKEEKQNKIIFQQEESNQIKINKHSSSQDRQYQNQIQSQRKQPENTSLNQQIQRLNKTESIQRQKQSQIDSQKQQMHDLKQRIMNYPQKSQSPTIKQNFRPMSAMDDKNITIMSLQLKDLKDEIEQKDLQKLCNQNGYHLVKFDQEFDKINNKIKPQAVLQIRGVNTDQKFVSFQRSLSRKGIGIGEQNQKLKDFVSNKYLLKRQEHSQAENTPPLTQDEKLFNNFKKFQSRQRGTFL